MSAKSPEDLARERIREAKRHRSTRLNLSDLGLQTVPATSGEFLWLCPIHYKVFDPGLPKIPWETGR
jgi:hypothetical protein